MKLTNFSDPLSANETTTLYPNGILLETREKEIEIELEGFGIRIRRIFGEENRVEIRVLEDGFSIEVCGLCGTTSGRLVYSDRVTEATSIDAAVIEDFAESWRVSPQEVLLGQQREECGNY